MTNTVALLDPSVFEAKAEVAASLLKAMSNPHRLMVLCRLGASEASAGELQADSGLSQSALRASGDDAGRELQRKIDEAKRLSRTMSGARHTGRGY